MNIFAASILIAWSVMFIRILVEVVVVNIKLLSSLVVPMITMAVLAATSAFLYYRWASGESRKHGSQDIPLKNPFSLVSALKFAVVFGIVSLLVKYVQQNFPQQGFYVVAALAGLTDVDAITLSMSEYAKGGGDMKTAVTSITIAAVTNTLVKCGFVFIFGEGKIRTLIGIATVAILIGGAVTVMFFI
jgi:uncharacterized membrane protein (DUF4010 family)